MVSGKALAAGLWRIHTRLAPCGSLNRQTAKSFAGRDKSPKSLGDFRYGSILNPKLDEALNRRFTKDIKQLIYSLDTFLAVRNNVSAIIS